MNIPVFIVNVLLMLCMCTVLLQIRDVRMKYNSNNRLYSPLSFSVCIEAWLWRYILVIMCFYVYQSKYIHLLLFRWSIDDHISWSEWGNLLYWMVWISTRNSNVHNVDNETSSKTIYYQSFFNDFLFVNELQRGKFTQLISRRF